MMRRLFLAGVLLLGSLRLSAQAVAPATDADFRPVGRFDTASAAVGEWVNYSLAVRHPVATQVLFPDSTFDFGDFEFVSYQFFPTVSDANVSYDSVVYTLRTFEPDTVLTLALPVFWLQGADSVARYAQARTFRVVPTLQALPEVPTLRAEVSAWPLPRAFNYPYWLAGAAAVLVVVGLAIALLGDRARQAYYERQLRQRQRRFERDFGKRLARWQAQPTAEHLSLLIADWKQHLEVMGEQPYRAYTTRDLLRHFPENTLGTALHAADRFIYGQGTPPGNDQVGPPLLEVSRQLYAHRQNDLRHAGAS